jgi:poly-gamma-glutamate capsule biosynthesis protein CapA/YwtB (metallophosphatase superfamily)
MLSLALVLVAAATPYEEGIQALQSKRYGEAQAQFEKCLAADPDSADCHWEIGWAFWMQSMWKDVVEHWTRVEELDRNREGLARGLAQAKENLALDEIVAKSKGGAPESYKSAAPEGATLRVRAVGDMMIGTDFPEGYLPPDDAAGAFDAVRGWLLDADITFGNLEGPLCDRGTTTKCKPDAPKGSCYAFRSPGRYAKVYALAGFDVVSTANNHAGDFGDECRLDTEKHLDEVDIAHSGRPGDIATLERNGLKVGLIGFHSSVATHNTLDILQAQELVRAMSDRYDLVIVAFHGGAEGNKAIHVPHGSEMYYGENRGDLRAFTHAVVDAGADLVLGSGPHVLRGMEIYEDRLIAYSLGNFATYGRFNISGNAGIGAILDVTLDKQGRFVSGRILSTAQTGEGIVSKDPFERGRDLVRTLSQQDFPGTGIKVALDGTIGR